MSSKIIGQARFWIIGALAVAAGSLVVHANWPAVELTKVPPQEVSVTSSEKLPPEARELEARSVSKLFDRDTTSEHTAFEASQILARLEAAMTVESVRFYGPAPYRVDVLAKQDGFWNPVAGLQNIDLSALAEQWHAFAATNPVTASELRFDLTPVPGAAGSGLREIEIWAEGRHVTVATGEQLRAQLAQDPPPAMQGRSYPAKQGQGVIGSPEGADDDDPADNVFVVVLDHQPSAIKRAWLNYETSGVSHWMGVVRSVNGQTARGGYIFNRDDTWAPQSEEISPTWLQAGENLVEFGTLEGFAHAYSVRDLRIELELDDGHNFVSAVTGNQSESSNDVQAVHDGDFATAWQPYPSGLALRVKQPAMELAFDRATQLDKLSLNLAGKLAGSLKVELLKDGVWHDVGLSALEAGSFQAGWNDIAVASGEAWLGARLTFSGGRGSTAEIREILAQGSGRGAAYDPPAIIVSYPDSGQYYGRTAFIRGFVQPLDNGSGPMDLIVAGRPIAHSNGEFEVAVSKDDVGLTERGDGKPWSVEINAVYPDGQMASKVVVLDDLLLSVQEGKIFNPKGKLEKLRPGLARKMVHDGAELEIGAAAVLREHTIGIKPLRAIDLPALDTGMTNVTMGPRRGYRMTPHPMKFKNKIRIKLPYDKKLIPAGMTEQDVRTFFFDENAGRWRQLEMAAVDAKTGNVTALTDHFTDFINATVVVPDSPEKVSFNPTDIKDIKAADPGAKINLIEVPQANAMGDAQLTYPIEVPPGRLGLQPQLAVQYNSSGGNGWMGMGWDLPMLTIMIDTRWGVPRYSATEETETYLLNGAQLTPVAHRGALQARSAEKVFHTRVEGEFRRIVRHGNNPANYWWEVTDKNGMIFFYGGDSTTNAPTADSTLIDGSGNIYEWALREIRDTNGNTVLYRCVRVSDVGVAGGTVPGSVLYLKDIFYTGQNGSQGPYRVTFTRDRELAEPRRLDVTIDARGGFKQVTADLLRKVDVSFNGAPVRAYEFTYQEGAFHKQLLTAVIQFGEDGLEFNRHSFEYFDEARDGTGDYKGFRPGVAWNSGNDNVERGFSLGIAEASAISGTSSDGFGGHLYVGVGPLQGDKDFSGGAKVGFSLGESETLLALIDIDGDGLSDKVYKDGGTVFYRANTSGPLNDPDNNNGADLGASFAAPVVVANLPELGRESNFMFSVGPEAYFGASVGANFAFTFNESAVYFSDVNGDGLPDLVDNGQVLFNSINGNGDPVFTPNSAETPYPIGSGSVDATGLIADYEAIFQDNIDNFPLMDTLRRWVAPFAGQIRITGDVALVEDTSQERQDYQTADGVRVAVQQNAGELWSTTIGATDYTPKTPVGLDSITVAKGEVVYFRVQSVFDGAFDQVSWSPDIQYLFVSPTLDANNLDVYRYNATDDFILGGFQDIAVGMPFDGTIRLEGELVKSAVTSDDVTVAVLKNGIVVHTQSLPWDQVGSIVLSHDLNVLKAVVDANGNLVQEADDIAVRVQVDSPIDLTGLSWSNATTPLRLFYTASPDLTELLDPNGDPLVRIDLFAEVDLYSRTNLAAPLAAWVAPQSGPITATPQLATAPGDTTTNGTVVVTVKRSNELVAKHLVTITNGTVANGSFTFNAVAGQGHFFEFSARDPALFDRLPQKQMAVILDPIPDPPLSVVVPSEFHGAVDTGLLPQPYRGWVAFGYDGNRERATSPIAIAQTDIFPDQNFDPETQKLKVTPYVPKPMSGRWEGPDNNTWAEASVASSSRNGPDFISVPRPEDFAGARAVDRLSISEQAGVSLGVVYLSGAATISRGESVVDFMDMNGDRFPDVLGKGGIQYSPMIGGLEAGTRSVSLGSAVRETDGQVANFGVGGNFPLSEADSKARTDAIALGGNGSMPDGGETGNQMPSMGLGGTLTLGSSDIDFDLMDLNGDGLPDRVRTSGDQIKVAFNLGYSFAAEEPWSEAEINHGENQGVSLNAMAGFNDGIYGRSGGINFSSSESESFNSLLDINGDGLLDRVSASGNVIKVGFNTGNGFISSDIDWPAAISQGLSRSKSETLGGGLYFTFTIKTPIGIKIAINPGISLSSSMARQEVSITDLDGDGYPDYLFSTDDDTITVGRGQVGRTNMLRKVTRPLGAVIAVDYERAGNTFDLPQRRWILASTVLFDGFVGDGADYQVSSFTYEDGKWERAEREFYGFGTVTEHHLDSTSVTAFPDAAAISALPVYRSIVRSFLNDNFYNKKLLGSQVTQDGLGAKFLETINTYNVVTVADGAGIPGLGDLTETRFPQLVRTDRNFYEGQPAAGKTTHQTYVYDALGNVTRFFDAADIGAADDVEALIGYFSDTVNYIVGKPNSIVVNGNATELRRREADIQPGTGNVLQLRRFLANGQAAVTDLTYDIFGNITTVTGPTNHKAERYQLTYGYDAVVNTYVVSTLDSFGYANSASYNLTYGLVENTTDINGQPLDRTYDTVGRTATITGPYQAGAGLSSLTFDYRPEAAMPWALTQHIDVDRDPADPIETVLFTDGSKRVLQTKKDSTIHQGVGAAPLAGMTISGRVRFDFIGREIERFYPVTETLGQQGVFNPTFDPVQPTVMAYDVLDRVLTTTIPDNTTTTLAYDFGPDRNGQQQFRTTIIDANGIVKESYRDVRELIVSVKEINLAGGQPLIWSSYAYDPLRQIFEVRDDRNNLITAGYDNFGRRTTVDSPDAGLTETAYDLADNPVQKITANLRQSGQAIAYDYTFNRLNSITYPIFPQNNVTYEYGAPGAPDNRADRITRITDATGVTERFYGPLGEVTKETKTIPVTGSTDPVVATTQFRFDTFNRMREITYPDGEMLTYSYDSGGLVRAAQGVKGSYTYDYVERLEYDKFEQRAFLELGNGVKTSYAYDPFDRRLANLQSTLPAGYRFQNLNYTYDPVGNITALVNDILMTGGQSGLGNEVGGPSDLTFAYDDLYRLTNTEGHYRRTSDKDNRFTLSMAYDTIHNITAKDQDHAIVDSGGGINQEVGTTYDWAYSYLGPQPHGPSAIGPFDVNYDANGNLIRKFDRPQEHTFQNIWDEENRLACHHEDVSATLAQDPTSCDEVGEDPKVRFAYDADGNRVIKDSDAERFYVNQYFTVKASDQHKHVFIGMSRLVSKLAKPDAGFEDLQFYFHPDHLGSTAYMTDREGFLGEHLAYFPFGETWVNEHPIQPITYQFTGKEIDQETGLYYFGARYYDPRTSLWQSPDPILVEFLPEARMTIGLVPPSLSTNWQIFVDLPSMGGVFEPKNISLYAYAYGNPVRFFDPNGNEVDIIDWFIGEDRGAAWRAIATDNWGGGPSGGYMPRSWSREMSRVNETYMPENARENGWNAWHAATNARLAQMLGVVGAPIIIVGGVLHETPADWESFWDEQEHQGTVNHFLDSVTDIGANLTGLAIGYAVPGEEGVVSAAEAGNRIPGPADPDRRFGGTGGGYTGNPSDAWGTGEGYDAEEEGGK